MAKTKKQKEQILEKLNEQVSQNKALLFADYSSVKSKDLFDLRDRLEEKEIEFQVVKNSLLKLVLENQKIKIPSEILDLPLAVAFADDEITPSKIIWDFARENENLKILGGLIDKEYIDADKISALALLPSREELYARLVSSISTPKYKLINALTFNQIKLVNILRSKNG